MSDYKTLESNKSYNGRIIDVYVDLITLPDGRTAYREVVSHGGAVAVLPILPNGDILLIKQYRHPAKSIVLEIPAGTLEKGEDPLYCAIRELEEETGFKTNDIKLLFKMYTAIGFCNEVIHVYIAKDLTEGVKNLDPDEFIETFTCSLDDAAKMIESGDIIDSKTIAAIMTYKDKI